MVQNNVKAFFKIYRPALLALPEGAQQYCKQHPPFFSSTLQNYQYPLPPQQVPTEGVSWFQLG